MANNYCTKEKEIAEIATKVDTIDKILSDNGGPGLHKQVIKLTENVSENTRMIEKQTGNINKLYDTVESLVRYKVVTEAEEELIIKVRKERDLEKKEKERAHTTRKVAVITAIVTIVLFLIDKFLL